MSIVVTGAAGFIGANIIKGLNERGMTDIIAVDNLTAGDKFKNLATCDIAHYVDKIDFMELLCHGGLPWDVTAIFHQGACSDTMNHDGKYMMANNYQYTLNLLDYCQDESIRLLYASSAAVYGKGTKFKETRALEQPLNVYGYSKFLFDQVLRKRMEHGLTAQAVGFRYFNVYGMGEEHKGGMASVAFHNFNQYKEHGFVTLFGAYADYENGTQSRDFISVEDVVKVNLYFFDHPDKTGIYNLGTGRSQPFNDLAVATVNACRAAEGKESLSLADLVKQKLLRYVDFPDNLKGKYQSFTQADISALRKAGYNDNFYSVEEGVSRYVKWLLNNGA